MNRYLYMLCLLLCWPVVFPKNLGSFEIHDPLPRQEESTVTEASPHNDVVDEDEMGVVRIEISTWREVKNANEAFKKALAEQARKFHLVLTQDIAHFWLFIFKAPDRDMEIVIEGKGDTPISLAGISFTLEAAHITMRNLVIGAVVESSIVRGRFSKTFVGERLLFLNNERCLRQYDPFPLVDLVGLKDDAIVNFKDLAFIRNQELYPLLEIRGKESKAIKSIILDNALFVDNRVSSSLSLDRFKKAKLSGLRVIYSGNHTFMTLGQGELSIEDSSFEYTSQVIRALRPRRNEVSPVSVHGVYKQKCDKAPETELLPTSCCDKKRLESLPKTEVLIKRLKKGDFL